jgi:PHD/YefM family antitoxin component YafN of YafNO toxin-antitoxin module
MKTISVDDAPRDFEAILDEVCMSGEPLGVRRNGTVYVITTLEDYEKDDETAFLTRHEANREALDRSIAQSLRGEVVVPDPALFR